MHLHVSSLLTIVTLLGKQSQNSPLLSNCNFGHPNDFIPFSLRPPFSPSFPPFLSPPTLTFLFSPFVLVSPLTAVGTKILEEGKLSKERFISAHSSWPGSRAGGSSKQVVMQCPLSGSSARCMLSFSDLSLLLRTPVHAVVPPGFRVGLPTSVKTTLAVPKDMSKCFFLL